VLLGFHWENSYLYLLTPEYFLLFPVSTLAFSTSPFWWSFFFLRAHKLLPRSGFEPQSSWSLPLEKLGLQTWDINEISINPFQGWCPQWYNHLLFSPTSKHHHQTSNTWNLRGYIQTILSPKKQKVSLRIT
jgi:hypothetical protein